MEQLVTLDFETYYSSTYGLTKQTTEEYIRHPEFQVIGVAIKINDDFFEAISNKADVFNAQGKFKESLIELNKIYIKEPNFLGVIQKIISNKMSIFDWENYDNLIYKQRILDQIL